MKPSDGPSASDHSQVEQYGPYAVVYGEIRYVNGTVLERNSRCSNTPLYKAWYGNITAVLRLYTTAVRWHVEAVILRLLKRSNTAQKRQFTVQYDNKTPVYG